MAKKELFLVLLEW